MQIVVAALFSVLFLFCLNHFANGPIFTRIGEFRPTAYDIFLIVFGIVLYFYFRWRSRKAPHERLTRKNLFWCVVALMAIVYVSLLSHLYNGEEESAAIALTAGFFATLGWWYTNYMNARHQQRAHTMNVLLSLRTNAVLNEHRINFFRRYPPSTTIPTADMTALKEEKLNKDKYNITSSARSTSTWDSIQYMLNLYEFICVGMRQGDLDESIIRMSLRGIFVSYHDAVLPVIEDLRTVNGVLQPRIYENYRYYVEKFRNL
jgi:hypothetical protein